METRVAAYGNSVSMKREGTEGFIRQLEGNLPRRPRVRASLSQLQGMGIQVEVSPQPVPESPAVYREDWDIGPDPSKPKTKRRSKING